MKRSELKKLSAAERLETMEIIWDSLLDDENNIESPPWHRDILLERKSKIEKGEAEFLSIEQLKAKLRS